ncbi:MAG: MFS transporter [Thermaerobacter sp.]|nr:MFS transporter [Thermaerobacter sp.]
MTEPQERGLAYKWIALSNTTLGVLMASMNQTIVMISLPMIFRGLHVNPLGSGQTGLLLWVLMGYTAATTVLLVTVGRISDTYGRVRFYNLGFVIFTLGSLLSALTPGIGASGEVELIVFRVVQGIGGAFLFANSAAILTDAFPPTQRGLALGVNQIAAIGGSVLGLVLGGVLATVNWRLVFLVSTPIGLLGTVWAYIKLREIGVRTARRLDGWGNLTFGVGLTALMVGLTSVLMPYRTAPMGWGNPMIQGALALGVVLLLLFLWIESRVADPMFELRLFRIRPFWAGNLSGFVASLSRGGLQFMLIIWLQGIWLPLHGVPFNQTPLLAGLDTLPMMAGFIIAGPISGILSDRYGARAFSTIGMLLSGLGFLLLSTLPANFSFPVFAVYLLVMGIGMGLFSSPNAASIMSAVPAEHRGVASGMRATFQNAGMMMSMAIFFTIAIVGLSNHLPPALRSGLTNAGLPAPLALGMSHLPPVAALFSALLGYNPLGSLMGPKILGALPGAVRAKLLAPHFFAQLISTPFSESLHTVFYISIGLSLIAAIASAMRGKQYIEELHGPSAARPPIDPAANAASEPTD